MGIFCAAAAVAVTVPVPEAVPDVVVADVADADR
jgi:hypothetical protein